MKLFGSPHESGMRQRCTNLIHAIGIWQPEILDLLKDRRKALDQAVQGNNYKNTQWKSLFKMFKLYSRTWSSWINYRP